MARDQIDPFVLLEHITKENEGLKWEPLHPSSVYERWQSNQLQLQAPMVELHRNWQLPTAPEVEDLGGGAKGRLLSRLGRLTYRVLGRRHAAEQEVIGNLVRITDALAKRCDELADALAAREAAEAYSDAKLCAWLHADFAGGGDHPA